jgi:hypothetical protein
MMDSIPHTEDITRNKKGIEKRIKISLASKEVNDSFVDLLGYHFKGVHIIDNKAPYPILHARYKKIPVSIMFCNGRWLYPDNKMIDLLNTSKQESRLPIFIAKKVHGLLYPFFKDISVLGTNIYSSLVSESIIEQIQEFNAQWEKSTLGPDLQYNEKVESVAYYQEIQDTEEYEEAMLGKFLSNVIPDVIEHYYSKFKNSKIRFSGTFEDVVRQITNRRLKNSFNKWFECHQLHNKSGVYQAIENKSSE